VVIVGGTFEMEPGQREVFLASRLEMIRISRAEPGCLEYTYSADPIEAGRVVLFERWEDHESLDAHIEALRARAAARDTADAVDTVEPMSSSITIYDIAGQTSF